MASEKAVRRNKADGDPKPLVWAALVCPFADRVLFALNELKIDYELKNVDLRNKPPELLKVNPLGKVPAIEDLGYNLYESMICVEYLDETFQSPTGKRLLPEKPAERAMFRMAADLINTKYTRQAYALMQAKSPEDALQLQESLLTTIAEINAWMCKLSPDGPYFAGDSVSYLDIALLPHFRRTLLGNPFPELKIPDKPEYQRILKWSKVCFQLPSHQKIVDAFTDEDLIEHYKKMLKKL